MPNQSTLELSQPPAWEESVPWTVERCVDAFDHTLSFTIGVEEELMLVDAESFDLAPAIDDVLQLVDGGPRYYRELRAAQLEIVTPVCPTAVAACHELAAARHHLIEKLSGRYRLLA